MRWEVSAGRLVDLLCHLRSEAMKQIEGWLETNREAAEAAEKAAGRGL